MIATKSFTLIMCIAIAGLMYAFVDITGHWTGSINGQFEVAYDFKSDGEKLTGTTKGPDGSEIVLADGWIRGDSLGFTLPIMGQQLKMLGKIKSADLMTVTMKDGPMGDVSADLKKSK